MLSCLVYVFVDDNSRVVLETNDGKSDYINANHVMVSENVTLEVRYLSYNRIYATDNNLNKLSRWVTCYSYYIVVLVMFDEMSMCDVMFIFDVCSWSQLDHVAV